MIAPGLKRYSKPRGAGDQTSGGRGKLLRATSGLSRIEILVRETLQNSWDARDDDWYPAYGVRVYRMDDRVRETLRESTFTDLPKSLDDLRESLSLPDAHAIEVFDRGTSGLDGPYRASVEARPGEPNNFNSFVFDIGTTKASAQSGGTYGFGKTATFEISRAHSVVYWSRCRDERGELEHRLIAASLHEPYADHGARYTGAHWWGDPNEDDIVPLRGEPAERLGTELFRTHFGEDETGTSIMIIDPVISVASHDDAEARERTPVRSDDDADQLVAQIIEALARSAWPKTIPADEVHPPMVLQVYKNRVEQESAMEIRSRFQSFAHSLVEVRRAQGQQAEGAETETPPHVIREKILPIALRPGRSMKAPREDFFGSRDDGIVGHLHLSEAVRDPLRSSDRVPRNQLCLMRSDAELVVRYEDIVEYEDDMFEWRGVFKPTPECDRHFASAEPPTHDSWTPSSAESEVSNYVVAKALQQIKHKTRAFLSERRAPELSGSRSVRKVATGLRGFVPLGEPVEAEGRSPRRNARRSVARSRTAGADVEVVSALPRPDGRGQTVSIRVSSPSSEAVAVDATTYAITADGRLTLEEDELSITWFVQGARIAEGASAFVPIGEEAHIELRTRVATALEIDLTARAVG